MKCAMIFADTGPIMITTCYERLDDPGLSQKLAEKGITKFIAFELSVEIVRQRYGHHFQVVCENLHETDELRVLDYEGVRVFQLFEFSEFGPPIYHEAPQRQPAT